ncbi:hypothetical protein PAGA_a2504 [Pseudoalteromonas agarivorans DSM 14585]|uniref:Uncharacterized protein n=1 Tax=Pseudoalteromonas agarivorans DSM 14585 TaxID=1312369 RepID=A0ACA8DXR2_9GAMM|nr:hypothetical protein PAGA_a2504 [Pseudoalteromonas agarivorans DSM 14585]
MNSGFAHKLKKHYGKPTKTNDKNQPWLTISFTLFALSV